MTAVVQLQPGSPEWLQLMTASKVAAVLGVSSYDSPRSLWHKMRGDVEPEPQTVNQARGHYLEPAILAWFFDQHPELQRATYAGDTHVRHDGWAACTPDAIALDSPDTGAWYAVEAKTDGGDFEWGKPGTDEIPVHIAGQCIWTCHILGAPRCYVPMLTQRLEFREYVVEADPELAADIEVRCRAFLDSLTTDQPPALDGHPATFATLKRLNPSITLDAEVQLTREQAARYVTAVTEHKAAERRHNLAKASISEAMGTAQYAYYGPQLVARRQNTASGVAALYAAKPLPIITETEAA